MHFLYQESRANRVYCHISISVKRRLLDGWERAG
jgi:hypothetical protein